MGITDKMKRNRRIRMGTAGGPGFMTEGEVNVPIAICAFKTKEWQAVEVHNDPVPAAERASTGGNDKSRPPVGAKLADLMVKGRFARAAGGCQQSMDAAEGLPGPLQRVHAGATE